MNKNKESLNSISSGDEETIPDEEYSLILSKKNNKSKTFDKQKNGPNINLKCFKKHYNSKEEKHFIHEKIKKKKKTELCKNWELYNDCFFKDECSFAHGIEELRTNNNLCGYKTKVCKSFTEKSYCCFGQRCTYKHILKEKRLFTYQSILKNISNLIINEIEKKENDGLTVIQIYQLFQSKSKLIIPRLDVFKNILNFKQNYNNNN